MITTRDIYGKEFRVGESELIWRPSAYGIIIHSGNILLSRQFGERYDLPGGGIELGESTEEGTVREVKEETGIDVRVIKLLGFEESFFTSSHDHSGAKNYHCLLFYYLCEYLGGEISDEGFDEEERHYADLAEWIPMTMLDNIEIASTVDYRKFIPKTLEGKI